MTIEHTFNVNANYHQQATVSNTDTCVFSLPQEYGFVLIGAACVAFLIILQGFVVIGSRRSKFFSKDFMKQFEAEHKRHFTSDITKSDGYPDMGNGLYGQKLPYDQWREFNQAQRVHYNFLEHIASVLVFILITGISYPWPAVGLSAATVIGRICYGFYIGDKGANNPLRITGALLGDIVLLAGFIMSVMSGLKMSCTI
ncbi:hypothetical protein PPERSA_11678 [Pseudocohnilembus persalinus]|uniref:Membrane-associated, eicosanoid/glutathione metabolism (MAPEG) protein n=1 Tax=Pseudocohnilembus persalinus TaxID=266149 RepID=A0A0V0QA51_PSEPJ|nr:hypothetical protein PPERSA_11678 [Pseudocohnilembus persalinus]|eukprot:KRW99077.1 hypothetical protein PPERSA_11678 [Pseudocohnilembus persalinus]